MLLVWFIDEGVVFDQDVEDWMSALPPGSAPTRTVCGNWATAQDNKVRNDRKWTAVMTLKVDNYGREQD